MAVVIYVIDTSSLIELKPYPKEFFPTLWSNLGSLIKDKRLISTEMVFKELDKYAKKDEITIWAQANKNIFKAINADQLKKVKKIIGDYRDWVDPDGERNAADPFVIALAMTKDTRPTLDTVGSIRIVVSEEKFKENKVNIPSVCQGYKIECISLFEMFRREGWKF
mgnify:CR=1 FL=1